MSNKNDPAFPVAELNDDGGVYWQYLGLTKREEFAKAAMQALCAYHGTYGLGNGPGEIAARATEVADTLLAQLGGEA